MNAEQTSITIEQARDVLRADYWNDIRDIIRWAREEIASGGLDRDPDSIREWLDQTVDGHERVIYTYQNLDTLLWASNHDAYTEEFGDVPTEQGGGLNWAVLAYAAMRADVDTQAYADGLYDVDDVNEPDDEADDATE